MSQPSTLNASTLTKAIVGLVVLAAGFLVVVGGLVVVSLLINAFVLAKLWVWFVVPLFGLPQLTIPYAIGLACVASALRHQVREFEKEGESEASKWGRIATTLLVRPALILAIGWIASRWV